MKIGFIGTGNMGGALAAAMSLAMLAGCSGNTTSGSSSTGETGTASESATKAKRPATDPSRTAVAAQAAGG